MLKKIDKYMRAHPWYNASIHAVGGIGFGVLITYPYISHPVRIGAGLILVAIFAHLYPLMGKK